MRKYTGIVFLTLLLFVGSFVPVMAEEMIPPESMNPSLSTIKYISPSDLPYDIDEVLGSAYAVRELRGRKNAGSIDERDVTPSYMLVWSDVSSIDKTKKLYLLVGDYSLESGTPKGIGTYAGYYHVFPNTYTLSYSYDAENVAFVPDTMNVGVIQGLNISTGQSKAAVVYLGPTIISDNYGEISFTSPKPWVGLENSVFNSTEEPPPSGIIKVLIEFILGLVDAFKSWLSSEFDRLMDWIGIITGVITSGFDGLMGFLSGAFDSLFGMLNAIIGGILDILVFIKDLFIPKTTIADLTGVLESLYESITGAFALMFEAFGVMVKLLGDMITTPAADGIDFGSVMFYGQELEFFVDFSMLSTMGGGAYLTGLRGITGSITAMLVVTYIRRLYYKFITDEEV